MTKRIASWSCFALALGALLAACGAEGPPPPTDPVLPTTAAPSGETPAADPSPTARKPSTPGNDAPPPSTAIPAPSPTAAGGATPAPTATAAARPAGWRADVAVGGNVGDRAPDTTVLLEGGAQVPLSQLADGKPLLLYFFATW